MTTVNTDSMTAASPDPRAFDVLFGAWVGHHRKLRDVTDPGCTDWVQFEASHETSPVLEGGGHIDVLSVAEGQSVPAFEALTLRLHRPEDDTWAIYWLSSRAPGVMDPPVIGRADAHGGIFECDDEVAGRLIRVRFTWDWRDPSRPVYQQAFTERGTERWETNWETVFTRLG